MKTKGKADCNDNGNQDKKNKINSNINNEIVPEKRKRGRPKGSTGNKRKDSTVNPLPGDNTKYLAHDLKLMHLAPVDINNPSQVQARIDDYIRICAEDDVKPSVASLALAFHVSRFILFDWITGRNKTIKSVESLHTLKTAYDMINSYYEHMMNNGKINPVAGIFLMKNNMGYQDTTQYVLSTNTEKQLSIDDISNRAGLLNE